MPVLDEVASAAKMTSNLIQNVRDLLETFSDGAAYLKRHHPDARAYLSELLEEMRKTVVGLITISSLITSFDFTIDGRDLDTQPAPHAQSVISGLR